MSTTGTPGPTPGEGEKDPAAQAAQAGAHAAGEEAAAQAAAGALVPQGGGEEQGEGEGGEVGGERPGKTAEQERDDRIAEQAEPSPLAVLHNAISANFRRAVMAAVLACAGLALTYVSGGVLRDPNSPAPVAFFQQNPGLGQFAAILGALVFFVFGVSAVRSATREILKTVPPSLDDNRKNGLRWFCLLVGYLVVFFGALGALNVPIERLLVGGAVTGVILGIAAQQSLGNLFAGLLLLITRPFAIGDEISLRSGPLGGVLTGLVADMNLNYVKIVTDKGTVLLPNSTILSASVGPSGVFDH
ncbi:MAG TPA: mechanosensitive ion channel family protein [Actinocrinis sp.]|nr:mechanosensitive ion channel family protein [Actinocrinis sp.]